MADLKKAGIIGCGAVGGAVAFSFLQQGLFRETVLLDADRDRAEGEAADLSHAVPYTNTMHIYAGDYPELADAGLVVIAAGTAQRPGQTRLDLAAGNRAILRDVLEGLLGAGFEGILLLVSNPVDVLTCDAQAVTGFSRLRVIGSGTALDAARLRTMLARRLGADSRDVHALVLGEHGDSAVAVFSGAHAQGMDLAQALRRNGEFAPETAFYDMLCAVRESGYAILSRKGATNWGVAAAVSRIARAVVRDERAVLPVSVCLRGEYGLEDLALSVPCVIGERGVERILEIPLDAQERAMLCVSAAALRAVLAGREPAPVL